MSFFTELKRRNVFRVAAAYVVSGWLLIEVGNTLEETLHLPDWADTLLAFFLIIGFPIALFVSWAYEITPEGIKREKEVAVDASSRSSTARKLNQLTVTVMALALAYFAVDKWVFTGQDMGPDSISPAAPFVSEENDTQNLNLTPEAPADEANADDTPSVAVLPFVNMSADPDNEYFSDGMSEELLNLLVKVEGLRVPSRTSSFAFKGLNTDIREIARQLDVGHILEGSVRKSGNKVRITAQLIDVSDDTHLWSETYDRELEDIFAIQDEIASRIVDALQLVLGTALEQDTPTQNLEAYNLYLRGLHLFQQRGRVLTEAESLLEEAVRLDPGFARAWGLLALVRVTAPGYLGVDSSEVRDAALDAADRASSLDPSLLEPMLVQSQLADFDESISLLESAIAQHPRVALARLWLGIDLLSAGYIDEAVAQLEESVRLDPIAGVNLDWLARAYVQNGQYENGVATARKAIQLGRTQALVPILEVVNATKRFELLTEEVTRNFVLGKVYLQHLEAIIENPDHYTTAVEWADQDLTDQEGRPFRLYNYARIAFAWRARQPEDADEYLRNIMRSDGTIITQLWQPTGQWFRNHPLGRQLMAEAGLPGLWQKRGWPDLCRRANGDDFKCE